ncbi:MAG: hypothetical protein ACREE3_05140, partial [Stellaceae bacterium]
MSAASDMPPPRRTDLSLLRWDAAWIDPAVRRMAEAAARQADLPIEIWMERAIRSACGMPKMAPPPSEAPRPT